MSNRWFDDYTERLDHSSVKQPAVSDRKYACPCCRYLTLSERGGFEICKVCFWEDDGQDDHDAEIVRGGPNGARSLAQARVNFAAFGACDEDMRVHVRPPTPDEMPR